MRGPHELVEVTTRLEHFDEIDRMMHPTEAAVSGDSCSVLELDFIIPNLALLLIKATVDVLGTFIHLLEASIHLLLHLFKPSIYLLFQFAKRRRNKLTLTEKLLPRGMGLQ